MTPETMCQKLLEIHNALREYKCEFDENYPTKPNIKDADLLQDCSVIAAGIVEPFLLASLENRNPSPFGKWEG